MSEQVTKAASRPPVPKLSGSERNVATAASSRTAFAAAVTVLLPVPSNAWYAAMKAVAEAEVGVAFAAMSQFVFIRAAYLAFATGQAAPGQGAGGGGGVGFGGPGGGFGGAGGAGGVGFGGGGAGPGFGPPTMQPIAPFFFCGCAISPAVFNQQVLVPSNVPPA